MLFLTIKLAQSLFSHILNTCSMSRLTNHSLSLLQRATLAEKEVTTLKEQLATTSPTPLQATVPPKTNGTHIDSRDQSTETRIDTYSPDIKKEKREDIDEDRIEMAATGRSNSNSSRSSPVQPGGLENELAAKEKEVSTTNTDFNEISAQSDPNGNET